MINGKTHEPIARVLVYSPDNRYATLTDDRGHFEFRFPPPEKSAPPVPTSDTDAEGMRKVQQWYARNTRPNTFFARRPGFLPNMNGTSVLQDGSGRAEIVITLEPEALIVGHVRLPGVDNTDRIQMQLYRQDFEQGHERWTQAGNFTTWATGEFRFSELAPGTYKLFTLERTERDPTFFNPGDQLYGFPPVFYPNGNDFSAAAAIKLATGATFQANLAVARREYYPVEIGVTNLPVGTYPAVEVYPQGHAGPGYSLGYDAAEQVVRGTLPTGNYTLKVFVQGETGSSGSVNFSVRGGPLEGPVVSLYPNVSLGVNITREFGPDASADGGAIAGRGLEVNGSGNFVSIVLRPVEQFGIEPTVMSQQEPNQPESGITLKNVAAGTYWMQISASNCYPASATWGGGDVLHRPITIGISGGGSPIEVTLRNDGAEVMGKVEFPERTGLQKPNEAAAVLPQAFVYFLPVSESAGQLRQTQVWNGIIDERQIAPGAYRILAFDQANPEIGNGNPDLLRKYESKGVVVELSASQTLRLSSPLALVSEP
ncbi:MAG TPA: hypothetical protein VNU20_00420 [Candidatus Sulfotelmatobacter sp.]|nr:hypothetical protein [Candidatus Sulfotelmatobacter sp.]